MSSQLAQLNNLTNHSLLRRNSARVTNPINRQRSERSQSPTNRGRRDLRSSTPTRDDFEQLMRSPTAATPNNQQVVPSTPAGFTLSTARRTLGGAEMGFLETMAMNAGLDPVHRDYAKYLAEVNGDTAQHIAHSVSQAKMLFNISKLSDTITSLSEKIDEVSNLLEAQSGAEAQLNGSGANPAQAWVCSPELHDLIASLASRLIVTPELESYTALEVNRVWLAHSLFSSIRTRLNQQPNEWKQQHLPGGSQGVQDSVGTRVLNTHIRNVCKHVREKLHNLLLTGIYDPKTGPITDAAVPSLKLLWHRIANRMGTAGIHADSTALWAHTDGPTRARLAYLRREAARIVQNGRGSSSIWACVDRQLAILRHKGDDYTVAFYKIVYDQDKEVFNFRNMFQDLKENCEFALPSDDIVEDAIEAEQPAAEA